MNCFAWGNLKSLKGDNEETLWDDLKTFYENQYSADRLKVVIQVKTDDDLAELRQWVTESFGIIEDKNYGNIELISINISTLHVKIFFTSVHSS